MRCIFEIKTDMKLVSKLFILALVMAVTLPSCAPSFQADRKAFQKARFYKTTTKYGRACEIFEKKRVKGQRKPLINLGSRRKSSSAKAEQN
jgi:hypothetical protein